VGELVEMIRGLGVALIEVLRAEAAALAGDLRRSGRDLGIATGLVAAAAGIGFWLVGLMVATLVAVLAIWLPVWGAALITLGIFILIAGGLVWAAISRFRRLESPAESIGWRIPAHVNWWQALLLVETSPNGAASLP
jgi:hypothetical protein